MVIAHRINSHSAQRRNAYAGRCVNMACSLTLVFTLGRARTEQVSAERFHLSCTRVLCGPLAPGADNTIEDPRCS